MRQLVAAIKLILFISTLLTYFASAAFVTLVIRDLFRRRLHLSKLVSYFSSFMCRIMGIKIIPIGIIAQQNNALYASNHLSYLDIMIHATLRPSCFVTSVEIKNTPGLGHICRLAACVFVERRSRQNLTHEIKDIADSLLNGCNITIFPEATSTNGDEVLRFKKPLFQAAINAQVPVVPVTINYEEIDERPVNLQNRDNVCWYGDMGFASHLWRVLKHKKIVVSLRYHPAITAVKDATKLAELSHYFVASSFHSLNTHHDKHKQPNAKTAKA